MLSSISSALSCDSSFYAAFIMQLDTIHTRGREMQVVGLVVVRNLRVGRTISANMLFFLLFLPETS